MEVMYRIWIPNKKFQFHNNENRCNNQLLMKVDYGCFIISDLGGYLWKLAYYTTDFSCGGILIVDCGCGATNWSGWLVLQLTRKPVTNCMAEFYDTFANFCNLCRGGGAKSILAEVLQYCNMAPAPTFILTTKRFEN
jgi:hypothetical protein